MKLVFDLFQSKRVYFYGPNEITSSYISIKLRRLPATNYWELVPPHWDVHAIFPFVILSMQ